MKFMTIAALGGAAMLLLLSSSSARAEPTKDTKPAAAKPARDYPVKPVPFTAVHLNDAFWAPRIEINRTVTIPFAFQKCEETGRVDNFVRAAEALKGEDVKNKRPPGYPFDDTDIYKVIEGASYALSVHPDPKLDAYVDGLIAKIAAAQEPDGYLYTARTIDPQHPHSWSGAQRWTQEENQSHELYDLGHLYEAASAHYQATGKRNLLNIAVKSADLLDKTFGPGKMTIWPGHEIVEMGLARLYRVTGNEHYLSLAKFFLDSRGPRRGAEYYQAQAKVVDQTEAVGHAVRAAYLYSGMADVAALTGDAAYVNAIDKIWENVVDKKLYITGGIGATGAGEAFGRNYELPNMSAYCETCAAVGNDYWNQRLFLLHGDACYVDVMERTLYNGLISGVSLDGKGFFYPNPLESSGQHARSPWFGVACCPGNITRFMASVPGYVYAQQGDALYVNLFAASHADIKMDNGRMLKIEQETRYPWDGAVKLTVSPDKSSRFAINLRIPGWARNEASPGDLYRFVDKSDEPVTLKVNGKATPLKLEKGYAVLSRTWKKGDTVELNLPMPVRRVAANESVTADRGRVALQRGPIVYCAEWPDNPNGHVRNLMLEDTAKLSADFKPDLLNGVEVIRGKADALTRDDKGKIVRNEQEFTAIPYYAWANRGRGEMMVWIPNNETSAHPLHAPTIASTSRVRTSGGTNPRAINDQEEPSSSGDESSLFFHWWPKKGTTEWVEYTFAKPETVAASEVYWFDDTGRGECRVPQSWRLLYRDGADWKPVETTGEYGVALNRYNPVTFQPVHTDAMRLEVTLQPRWSAGIQEWHITGSADSVNSAGQTNGKYSVDTIPSFASIVAVISAGQTIGKAETDQAGNEIKKIDPPEKGFFTKLLDFHGILIKAPEVVSDKALLVARDKVALELKHLPDAMFNLARAGAELHIIGKDQVTSDLPEWRSFKGKPFDGNLTIDQRTRGMGGLLTSCGEENLLQLPGDRYRGRDICLHEFAHNIQGNGLSRDVRQKIRDQYHKSLDKGLWKGAYAASNENEFFAELTMWYFGTHGDMNMTGVKPANGPEGLKAYDPDAYKLLDDLYSGRIPVERVKTTALKAYPPEREKDLRSGSELQAASILFINRTAKEIRLYWVDGEGKRKQYGTVAPGGRASQGTFASHVWLVTDPDDKPLALFVAETGDGTATVR